MTVVMIILVYTALPISIFFGASIFEPTQVLGSTFDFKQLRCTQQIYVANYKKCIIACEVFIFASGINVLIMKQSLSHIFKKKTFPQT